MALKQKKRSKWLVRGLFLLAATAVLWLYLQHVFPHRHPPFTPGYSQQELSHILAQASLSQEDYQTLFDQTGLAPAAIDALRARGSRGLAQILETQDAFFHPPDSARCDRLGITTREHRFWDEAGYIQYAVPLAPLKEGDILVSFSTHTAGWTHGHAGLVLDPDADRPVTLESVVLGTLSDTMNANHWRSYTTLLVLRPKADDDTRHLVVELARTHLDAIPYSLVSGVFGDKFQSLDGPHSAQCGYLPWYAWMAVGLDLDGDGGRIVAPEDLSISPNVEVIQVFGVDPAQIHLDFPG